MLTAVLVAAPGSAHAGRTFFGWLYGTEVMPERGAELQSWITEENKPGVAETSWLIGAQVGITDQLEIGFPTEFTWEKEDPNPGSTRFNRFGVEARYRFVTQDPVDAPQFVPLVRVAVKRMVTDREGVRPEVDLVMSYESGIAQVLVDLGFVAELTNKAMTDNKYELHPGVGLSVLAVDDLRVGAEVYMELKTGDEKNWFIAGPDLSWTHGRFWLSAVYGIGLKRDYIHSAPRIQWGIAF